MSFKKSTLMMGLSLFLSLSANATLVDVYQGGVLIGQAEAYEGSELAIQNRVMNVDSKIGAEGIAASFQLFFYENPVEGLTFSMMNNMYQGEAGNLALTAYVNSDSNPIALYGDDNFNEFYESETNDVFSGKWAWADCCTDGGAIGGLTGDWDINMDINSYFNVTQFLISNKDGSTFGFDPTKTLTFSSATQELSASSNITSDVPVNTGGVFALGLAFLIGRRLTSK